MPNPPPAHSRPPDAAVRPEGQARPTVIFDWRDWLPYLDDPEIPEAEARELIEIVWAIVLSFVDLDCEIAGREAAGRKESCGQAFDLAAALGAVMVRSKDSQSEREDA